MRHQPRRIIVPKRGFVRGRSRGEGDVPRRIRRLRPRLPGSGGGHRGRDVHRGGRAVGLRAVRRGHRVRNTQGEHAPGARRGHRGGTPAARAEESRGADDGDGGGVGIALAQRAEDGEAGGWDVLSSRGYQGVERGEPGHYQGAGGGGGGGGVADSVEARSDFDVSPRQSVHTRFAEGVRCREGFGCLRRDAGSVGVESRFGWEARRQECHGCHY
mmetsp:Transcript_15713/g.23823  ORF Transcript_15713/g.23823 Transcript_15713/m.23823 type:complete len:215 (+) Transcript_15713:536-1180(+)